MISLSAASTPIVVDLNNAKNGVTTVEYHKELGFELWHRPKGGQWIRDDDPTTLYRFKGKVPEITGTFSVRLSPGEFVEVAIFPEDRGPDGDPEMVAHLVVFAVARRPRSDLIESEDSNTGGTWHRHVLSTEEPTFAVAVSASLTPLTFDGDGYPHPGPSDGETVLTLQPATSHDLTTLDLLPGTPYAYLVVVIDDEGRWDYRAVVVTTLRRVLTVQFEEVHIYDNGDTNTDGDVSFLFRVMFMKGPGQPELIEEFVRPEAQVKDGWKYPIGFAHVGAPKRVHEGEQVIWVSSLGFEDDLLEYETAWSKDASLVPPVGPGETVTNATLHLDCPPASVDTDLHYGVDVVWSVAYEP